VSAPSCPNDRALTREEIDALASWHDARRQDTGDVVITVHTPWFGGAVLSGRDTSAAKPEARP
jgi:hypothetical protein